MANILDEVQHYVAGKLNSELSTYCTFVAENRKDIDFEIKSHLGKQGIVGLVMTPKATFAGKYEDQSIAWELQELEVDIVENVSVNRGQKPLSSYMTGQDAAMELFSILCPLSGEHEGQFCPVSYEEGEDGSLIVNKCVLKCLVHASSSEPQPFFPDKQGILLSDGTRLPVADSFFYGMSDVDIMRFFSAIGYPLSSVVEIDAFSKIGGNGRLYSDGLSAAYIDSTCESIDQWSNLFGGQDFQKAVFRGRTLYEVQAMSGYPWGLADTSKIVAEPDPPTVARYTDGSVLELDLSGTVQQNDVPKKNGAADLQSVELRVPVSGLGDSVFKDCSQLTAASMPSSMSDIGMWTFMNCSSLVSVEVPAAVPRLDNGVFYNCASLSSVTLPSQLSGMGNQAFSKTAIVEFPKLGSLKYISSQAFASCSALTYMCIPQQTQIYPDAFRSCPSLTCLAFEGKTEEEVQAMQYYPWGIEDTNVISAELTDYDPPAPSDIDNPEPNDAP